MNMRYYKKVIRLSLFLISLLLISCENPTNSLRNTINGYSSDISNVFTKSKKDKNQIAICEKAQANSSALGIENFLGDLSDINCEGQCPADDTNTIELSNKVKIPFVISGGISSIKDIEKIKLIKNSNIEGIIVGKSIYDEDIKIEELAQQI